MKCAPVVVKLCQHLAYGSGTSSRQMDTLMRCLLRSVSTGIILGRCGRDSDVHKWVNCFILGKKSSSEVKRSRNETRSVSTNRVVGYEILSNQRGPPPWAYESYLLY